MEQANYMPVITDSYDDDCVGIILDEIEKFLSEERECDEIVRYDETVKAQSDAYAEIADMLEESNEDV